VFNLGFLKGKQFIIIFALLFLLGSFSLAGYANNQGFAFFDEEKEVEIGTAGEDYVDGELIVKFDSSATVSTASAAHSQVEASFKDTVGSDSHRHLVEIPEDTSVEEALLEYEDIHNIKYASPNYIYETQDTNYPKQDNWGLEKINAPEAWEINEGSDNVTVAVIDTGVDYNHDYLEGLVNKDIGYDFVDDNDDPDDRDGHGTHVAGTIATLNLKENIGVMSEVEIMPIRALNGGGGTSAELIPAIEHAIDEGADIINASWGYEAEYDDKNDKKDSALKEVLDDDVLVVAAAGNEGTNDSAFYPASYDLDNIISVAATDKDDERAGFSNYLGDEQAAHLAAPGVDIYSTVHNNGYEKKQGTSMAAPHVAGVAGLLLSQNSELGYGEVKDAILDNVDKIDALEGKTSTGGRLNAYEALLSLDELFTISLEAQPAEGGKVEGEGKYPYEDEVTVEAIPEDGYEFVNWTENDDVVSEEKEYTFTAEESRHLKANFEIKTYEVDLLAEPSYGGDLEEVKVNENPIELEDDKIIVEHGDEVQVIAKPKFGYEIDDWEKCEEWEKDEEKENKNKKFTVNDVDNDLELSVYFDTCETNTPLSRIDGEEGETKKVTFSISERYLEAFVMHVRFDDDVLKLNDVQPAKSEMHDEDYVETEEEVERIEGLFITNLGHDEREDGEINIAWASSDSKKLSDLFTMEFEFRKDTDSSLIYIDNEPDYAEEGSVLVENDNDGDEEEGSKTISFSEENIERTLTVDIEGSGEVVVNGEEELNDGEYRKFDNTEGVDLKAKSNDNWEFVGWKFNEEESIETTDETTSVTMNSDKTVKAVFEPDDDSGNGNDGGGGAPPPPPPPDDDDGGTINSSRMAGDDRYETAVQVSNNSFESGRGNAVVLARGDDFPDALAGVPLAYDRQAPLLLTSSSELNSSTAGEIERVLGDNGTIYLLGGEVALSASVKDELEDMGYQVERLAGDNRYETAVAIAEELGASPDEAFLATGREFADAVSVSSVAALRGAPVLLTHPDDLSGSTARYLDENGIENVHVIGGEVAISDSIKDEVGGRRVAGAHRWETSVAIAQEFFNSPEEATMATSADFPDALSGGVYAALGNAPVLLTTPDNLHDDIRSYLQNLDDLESISVLGGEAAVSSSVLDEIEEIE